MPKDELNAKVDYCGMLFSPAMPALQREIYFVRNGGQWKKKNGGIAGKGLFYHIKRMQNIIWPEKYFTKWSDMLVKAFCENRIIAIMGPASSGKSHESALFSLCMFYAMPEATTVLVCSTEMEALKLRVWSELVKYHKVARSRFDLPGEVTQTPPRIIMDKRFESEDGRDFRNGFAGIAAKRGSQYQGMSGFVGVKNKLVILLADECSLMPRGHVDAVSNLNKNPSFICIASGNPKETTDALGILAEPSAELGGWDSGIDQSPGSKTWKTRFQQGICVQLQGEDSPNFDVPEGQPPPFPFLITRENIKADIQAYGRESIQFLMMNAGVMPRGQSLRRVLSRAFCMKFQAFDAPVWLDERRTRIGFLDAAYGSTGGDRCVFGEIQFGISVDGINVLALIDTVLVPVSALKEELPEDQIANFVRNQCQTRGIPPDNVYFDSTGRGALMGSFARLWSPMINGVEFGGKPDDVPVSNEIQTPAREYYDRKVTQLWFTTRLVVESGQFRGMTEDALMEFSAREWGIGTNNKKFVEPKDQMKIKTGRSPDIADAIVVGVWGATKRGFVIKKLSGPGTVGSSALKRLQELQDQRAKFAKASQLTYS
jgi:hypothetical protein